MALIFREGCSSILLIFIAANFSPAEGASSEELANVSLRMYLGNNIEDNYIDAYASEAVKLLKNIDSRKPTVFYIHGFSENLDNKSPKAVIGAYLKRRDHNVIAANYSQIASKNYILSATSAPGVGKVLAKALSDMVADSLDPRTLHVVGHSLGGQVAGYVGRNVDFKLPRITGLDPAGPGFYLIADHLTSNDAEFVDVIHTDAGIYGIAVVSGDVDFYPNDGIRVQPGCPHTWWPGDTADFCSHHSSYKYYAESVTDEKAFIGVKCDGSSDFRSKKCKNNKKVVMGLATPIGTKGTFYLDTNAKSPYGRGEESINPISKSIWR